ncbi:MAG: branched-chain amino acid ABC transporter permease [Nitrososphaerota archaeon]|nr:branched-chain amino acid ABC transporter permease [Candidatus Bathyarchaeota archaeon]MDW8024211.1 branched-chain amino acid ABC transporter permease [Nitrososphaerota archaeon]
MFEELIGQAILVLIYGLSFGCILAIISIGLSLTYGLMRVLNISHAILYALGAYMLYTIIVYFKGNFLYGILAAIGFTALIGLIEEKVLIRRLYGKDIDFSILITYAVVYIVTDVIKIIWGLEPKPVADPVGTAIPLLGMSVPAYRVLIIVLTIAVYTALTLFLKKTMIGKIIRAGLEDRESLQALGIDPSKSFVIMFVIGSSLAGLGGALYAPIIMVFPYMGHEIIPLTFATVVTGGIGSLKGSLIGGIILGLSASIGAFVYGPIVQAMPFIAMLIVLAIKPGGIFGE